MLVDYLRSLIEIPSESGNESAVADYIEELLKDTAFEVVRDKDDNIFAFINGRKPVLTLNGHIDTVPPVNWKESPYIARIIDNKIYGLGSSDMKSGVAVMLDIAQNYTGDLPLCLAFTVNEEHGTDKKEDGVRTFLKNYRTKYAITLEPSSDKNRVMIGIGCQGRIVADYSIKGRAVHSSIFERGDNAIYRACDIVRRITQEAELLEYHEVAENIFIKPSLSVTKISGGLKSNIVPDQCNITVDRRISPDERIEDVENQLKKFGSYKISNFRPPFIARPYSYLLKVAERVYRQMLGYVVKFCFRGWVDAAYFHQAGAEAINIGPGTVGVGHSADEFCYIKNLYKVASILNTIITELEQGDEPEDEEAIVAVRTRN